MTHKLTKQERLFSYLKFIDGFFIDNNLSSPLRPQQRTNSTTAAKANSVVYKTSRSLNKRILTKFIKTYDLLINETEKYDLPFTIPTEFFLFFLYQQVRYNLINDILVKISQSKKGFPSTSYIMALYCFDKAELSKRFGHPESPTQRNALEVIIDIKLYRHALNYLNSILKYQLKNASLCFITAACNAAVQEYESALRYLDIGRDLVEKNSSLMTPRVLQFEVVALQYLAHKYGCDRKYEDMLGLLLRANMLRPDDYYTTCLLSIAYNELKMHRVCIKILSRFRKLHPKNIYMYECIGKQFLILGNFYYASLYFLEGMEQCQHYPFKERLEIYYTQAQGMWYIKQGLTKNACRSFTRCGELVKKYNLQKYRHWTIFPDLLEVDKQIELISHSYDQEDFEIHIAIGLSLTVDIIQKLGYLSDSPTPLREPVFLGKLLMALEAMRDKFYDPLKLLLISKLFYLQNLNVLLLSSAERKKAIKLPKFVTKTVAKGYTSFSFYEAQNEMIRGFVGQFEKLGFKEEYRKYIGLQAFTKALGERPIGQISENEWPSLMALLSQYSEKIGKCGTESSLQEISKKIDKIEMILKKLEEQDEAKRDGILEYISKHYQSLNDILKKISNVLIPSSNRLIIKNKGGKWCIVVNNRLTAFPESCFARFLLCVASHQQGEYSLKKKELFLSKCEQELTVLRKLLKTFNITIETKGNLIYYEIPYKINMDKRALCKFESEHYEWLVRRIEDYSKNIGKRCTNDSQKKEKTEEFLLRQAIISSKGIRIFDEKYGISPKLTSVVRNTELIRTSIEKMGWSFRDKSWYAYWENMKNTIDEMLNQVGYEPLKIYFAKE